MNGLIIFAVKAAIYLTAFYLVYAILLSKDTSYQRNRVYILISLLLSLILPLVTLHTNRPLNIQFLGKMLNEVFITASPEESSTLVSRINEAGTLRIIFTIYIIGVALLFLKLIADLLNLLILIERKKEEGTRIIRFNSFNTTGFSAMGYIFLNSRLSDEESSEIIRHEENHLKRNHFIDIILIETIKAFQWFNPVIYLLDRSLRAIHEYQADQECLSSGIPVVNYQSLLLSQVFKSRVFNLTNSFSNPSLIKKRMVMMTKKRSSSLAGIKLLVTLPVAGLIFFSISAYREIPESPPPPTEDVKQENREEAVDVNAEVPFVVVEEMPRFPGGDAELLKYIAGNTQYPHAAKEQNIQGRVIVRFCVTAKGGISQVSILKGVSPELDSEALRVVNSLPSFEPGRQAGKAVPVWYMVPITFTLK